MAETATATNETAQEEAAVSRIYEIGYHISPSVKEEDIEKVVSGIRAEIEKSGGSFIAEGAPAMLKLAYDMTVREGEKNIDYDRAYFGWLKFESTVEASKALEASLQRNTSIVRSIVFQTVREDTRAKYKAPTLREVKRTDVIKAAPRKAEEAAAPVSEEDLDKALKDLTTE